MSIDCLCYRISTLGCYMKCLVLCSTLACHLSYKAPMTHYDRVCYIKYPISCCSHLYHSSLTISDQKLPSGIEKMQNNRLFTLSPFTLSHQINQYCSSKTKKKAVTFYRNCFIFMWCHQERFDPINRCKYPLKYIKIGVNHTNRCLSQVRPNLCCQVLSMHFSHFFSGKIPLFLEQQIIIINL